MKEEPRLVWQVDSHWKETTNAGRFPRRDEIDPWTRGKDGANCLLIAVESPIELSHFAVVGVNPAIALCRWRGGSGRKILCSPIVLPRSNRTGPQKAPWVR